MDISNLQNDVLRLSFSHLSEIKLYIACNHIDILKYICTVGALPTSYGLGLSGIKTFHRLSERYPSDPTSRVYTFL